MTVTQSREAGEDLRAGIWNQEKVRLLPFGPPCTRKVKSKRKEGIPGGAEIAYFCPGLLYRLTELLHAVHWPQIGCIFRCLIVVASPLSFAIPRSTVIGSILYSRSILTYSMEEYGTLDSGLWTLDSDPWKPGAARNFPDSCFCPDTKRTLRDPPSHPYHTRKLIQALGIFFFFFFPSLACFRPYPRVFPNTAHARKRNRKSKGGRWNMPRR